jgi:hypothetical protein
MDQGDVVGKGDSPDILERLIGGGEEAQKEDKGVEENEMEEEGETYVVEQILKARRYRGRLEYLVKWEGFADAENTWEPSDNLAGATEAINDFLSREKVKSLRPLVSGDSDVEALVKNDSTNEDEAKLDDAFELEEERKVQKEFPVTRHQYQAAFERSVQESLKESGVTVSNKSQSGAPRSRGRPRKNRDLEVEKPQEKLKKEKTEKNEKNENRNKIEARGEGAVVRARPVGGGVVFDVKFSSGKEETIRKEHLMRQYPQIWLDFVKALLHWDDHA